MEHASGDDTPCISKRQGRMRRLLAHLRGSRKKAVLAAVDACRLDRLDEVWRQDEVIMARIETSLCKAEESVSRGDIQAGWACSLAARRMHLLTAPPDRVFAESRALCVQAERLSGWQGKAIQQLLSVKEGAELRDQNVLLRVACELRDEALQDKYHRVDILREQLYRLGAMLAFAVIVLLVLAIQLPVILAGSPMPEGHAALVAYVAAFGALGGSLSAIQWVIKAATTGSGPPEMRLHGPVVYMRPLSVLPPRLPPFRSSLQASCRLSSRITPRSSPWLWWPALPNG
jgi:hypothetical protein